MYTHVQSRLLYNMRTLPCIVLCCLCDLSPSHLSSLGTLIYIENRVENRVSWVQSHLRQLIFLWKKELSWVLLCIVLLCLLSPVFIIYNVHVHYIYTVHVGIVHVHVYMYIAYTCTWCVHVHVYYACCTADLAPTDREHLETGPGREVPPLSASHGLSTGRGREEEPSDV